jgi:hypothetical protein
MRLLIKNTFPKRPQKAFYATPQKESTKMVHKENGERTHSSVGFDSSRPADKFQMEESLLGLWGANYGEKGKSKQEVAYHFPEPTQPQIFLQYFLLNKKGGKIGFRVYLRLRRKNVAATATMMTIADPIAM